MDRFRALLNDLGDALDRKAITLEASARLTAEHIRERLNCSRVSMWVCEGDSGQRVMRRMAFHDVDPDRNAQDAPFPLLQLYEADCGQYVADLQRNSVFVCHDAASDHRLGRMNRIYLEPSGITTFLDAAIGANGCLWGAVNCVQRGAPRRFTTTEAGLLKRYADAISLRRAQRRAREAGAQSLLRRD
jgi:GAF domain-containing protein